MRRTICIGAALLALAACGRKDAPADAPAAAPAETRAASGLDLGGMDKAIKPGDDFYAHANGAWLRNVTIPEDRSSYGVYAILAERRESQLKALLERAASAPAGSDARKAADHYLSYLDVAALDSKGLQPFAADIAQIRGLKSASELMAALGRKDLAAAAPFAVEIDVDVKRPDAHAVYLGQSGLGLPDRAYYLEESFARERAAYQAYIAELFALAGESAAAERAAAVYALEERIAEAHWEEAKRNNRDLAYNPTSLAALKASAPADWEAFFAATGLPPQSPIILREDDAVARLARLVAEGPLDAWRDYLLFHLLHAHADILPQKFDAARAAFRETALGQGPRRQERWRRAVGAVDRDLGPALGQLYAETHVKPAKLAAAAALSANLKTAFAARIEDATWMSADAKTAAREKLERLEIRIGALAKPRDISALEIVLGDAYGNRKRIAAFEGRRAAERLLRPVDASEGIVTPQTADMSYDPRRNEIVVPAAMLEPPFFDPQADGAVNYGALGALIGHEMSHAFDARGRRTDPDGLIRDWWTGEDAAGFRQRAAALSRQIAGVEIAPGLSAKPDLVIGEAAADLAGLAIAHEAYRLSLKGAAAPALDGLSGDQRFFIAYAQMWRRAVRDEQLRAEIVASPLPPAALRVNSAVRNLEAWQTAFGVAQGQTLYLPPAERVRIW